MLGTLLQKITFRHAYTEPNITVADEHNFHWNQETDLIVAGFGGAGAAAALEARELGLDTIALDRLSGGGATTISGGILYAGGGTRIQKEAGVEDSPENMFRYLKHEVRGAVSDETLKRFCNDSVANFDWMERHGVKFHASPCPFKVSFPPDQYYFYYSGNEGFAPYTNDSTPAMRGHRGHIKSFSGPAIFEPLRESAKAKGVRIQTRSKVVSLLSNAEGRVIGVKALQLHGLAALLHLLFDKLHIALRNMALFWPPLFALFGILTELLEKGFGKTELIRARKGVVLATGGFFCNQSMVQQHAPHFVGGKPLGTLTDDGSGISMATRLGAQTLHMESVSAWRFINPPTSLVKGILVGPSGKRICNEMLNGAQLGDEIMRHHNGKGFVILDKRTRQAIPGDLTLKKAQWFHIMLGYFFIGFGCKKADTIEALALKLGMDPGELQKTISEYNRTAASEDPDPLGKPKSYMPPLQEGPYYAVNASFDYSFVPCPSLTLGGLAVNEATGEVLHQNGATIPGLYAAGRAAAGIPSRGYVSGLSIADCIFSGRRAARHAAGI